jgi:hypothetical protein
MTTRLTQMLMIMVAVVAGGASALLVPVLMEIGDAVGGKVVGGNGVVQVEQSHIDAPA